MYLKQAFIDNYYPFKNICLRSLSYAVDGHDAVTLNNVLRLRRSLMVRHCFFEEKTKWYLHRHGQDKSEEQT